MDIKEESAINVITSHFPEMSLIPTAIMDHNIYLLCSDISLLLSQFYSSNAYHTCGGSVIL